MSLSSIQLEAFTAVARTLHFHAQPVYPQLQSAVLETLLGACKDLLEK